MEPKKLPKLELNNKYNLFLNIGLVVSLSFCLIAFEWKTYEDLSVVDIKPQYNRIQDIELVKIPPTDPPLPKEPEKIIAKADQKPVDISNIVEVLEKDPAVDLLPELTSDIPDIPFPTGNNIMLDIPEEKVEEPILNIFELEKEPEGREAFYKYISKHIKYPKEAQQANIKGTVYVQFVIDKDGSISDLKVVKGIGYGCDEEAIRVIQNAPKWTPGKQRGRPVRVRMVLPVSFRLN
jgi:protein TonB